MNFCGYEPTDMINGEGVRCSLWVSVVTMVVAAALTKELGHTAMAKCLQMNI